MQANDVSPSGLSRDGQRAEPVGAARMPESLSWFSLAVPVIQWSGGLPVEAVVMFVL